MSEILHPPTSFEPPALIKFTLGGSVAWLVPLSDDYVEVDMATVNTSIDLIRDTRGGSWPESEITLSENRADLAEHIRQFESGEAFAYAIFDDEVKRDCEIGCIYIYPTNASLDDSPSPQEDADAAVSFWLSSLFYTGERYHEVWRALENWLKDDWSWIKNPEIVNKRKLSEISK